MFIIPPLWWGCTRATFRYFYASYDHLVLSFQTDDSTNCGNAHRHTYGCVSNNTRMRSTINCKTRIWGIGEKKKDFRERGLHYFPGGFITMRCTYKRKSDSLLPVIIQRLSARRYSPATKRPHLRFATPLAYKTFRCAATNIRRTLAAR